MKQVINSDLSDIMRMEGATYTNKMSNRVGLMNRLTKQLHECDDEDRDHAWVEDGKELKFHLPAINLIPGPNL